MIAEIRVLEKLIARCTRWYGKQTKS